jgi:uncharacterized protein
MAFEAQWPVCRQGELVVPGLPAAWSGTRVLHLSDVHAGQFPTNDRSFAKVVEWAAPLEPDLVFLTGDVLGDPRRSSHVIALLARLRPRLGTFAVTGNHEYGLGKGPLARARDVSGLWDELGITLLCDTCVSLPERAGTRLVLCGADYLTNGFGLFDPAAAAGRPSGGLEEGFPILLVHEPPAADSALAARFPLAFAGHTHGGQLRVPTCSGLRPLVKEGDEFLSGVYEWGQGLLVVSRGVGTSFLPFRLLTRPEATLWRLSSAC